MKKDNGVMVLKEVTDTLLSSDSTSDEVRIERAFVIDTYINPFPGFTSLIKVNPRIVKLIERIEEYINAKAINVYIDNYDTTSITFDCTEKSDTSKLSSLIEKNNFAYLTTKDGAEVFYFKILSQKCGNMELSQKCGNTEIELNSKFWIFDELLLFSSLIKEELKKEKKTKKKKEAKEKGKKKKDSSKKKNKKK